MTSDLQFPLIRLDPRTVHHRPQGGGLRATQREAFDDLPWEGHRQSDLLWNGLKGSPSIRPPLERLPTGTVWKGHRQSDPNWNGLKGSTSIRHPLKLFERIIVSQTSTGETSEKWDESHMGFPERDDIILIWTELWEHFDAFPLLGTGHASTGTGCCALLIIRRKDTILLPKCIHQWTAARKFPKVYALTQY